MASHSEFDEFVSTIATLRAPGGCPWDRAQTHETIAQNMIEEAYETVDAIEQHDVAHMREELGDVLLQVVLQSQIAADADEFTIDDVCADINAKMIRRHPHVFGDEHVQSASEVLDLWDQVKLSEKTSDSGQAAGEQPGNGQAAGEQPGDGQPSGEQPSGKQSTGVLDGVPVSFPALTQAQKISRKAAAVGFEWDTIDDIWLKVNEEMDELKDAYAAAPKAENGKIDKGDETDATDADERIATVEDELGDVFFTLVNVARRMGVDSERALRGTCTKFRNRWSHMEKAALEQGHNIEELTSDELEVLWNNAKQGAN